MYLFTRWSLPSAGKKLQENCNLPSFSPVIFLGSPVMGSWLGAHLFVGWQKRQKPVRFFWQIQQDAKMINISIKSNSLWIKIIIWAFDVVSAGIWTYGIKCIISNRAVGETPLNLGKSLKLLFWGEIKHLIYIVESTM